MDIASIGAAARRASRETAVLSGPAKDRALSLIAQSLQAHSEEIADANGQDLSQSAAERLSPPLLKRLAFDSAKLKEAVRGLESLAALPDPVGRETLATELDEGLVLKRVTCPIGVIGVIFESRPDALVQIASLCLKSGNAVILKGGSEARRTNAALAEAILEATDAAGISRGWLHLLETREDVAGLLKLDKYVDLIIPRGSNEFVRYIMDNTRIPVMGHADGICHVYVDAAADVPMAVRVTADSKAQYAAVCNAAETLLVHKDIAAAFLPPLKAEMDRLHVELRGDAATRALIDAALATEADWAAEYLDYILSVRVVDSLDAAVEHINMYGSGHTESIVTGDAAAAERFMSAVDSANVYHNASTRFADGFRYGFGAEVGVSTGRLHARGPVGVEGLLSYKYKLYGHGDIVADYAEGRKSFKHRPFPQGGADRS